MGKEPPAVLRPQRVAAYKQVDARPRGKLARRGGAGGLTHPSTPESAYAIGVSSQNTVVSGGVLRYAEAERLHAERVRPVRLITQHVLELLPRLLVGARSIGPPHIEVSAACFSTTSCLACIVR